MARITVSISSEDVEVLTTAAQANEIEFSDYIKEVLEVKASDLREQTPEFKKMVADREARQREERERQTKPIEEEDFEA